MREKLLANTHKDLMPEIEKLLEILDACSHYNAMIKESDNSVKSLIDEVFPPLIELMKIYNFLMKNDFGENVEESKRMIAENVKLIKKKADDFGQNHYDKIQNRIVDNIEKINTKFVQEGVFAPWKLQQ